MEGSRTVAMPCADWGSLIGVTSRNLSPEVRGSSIQFIFRMGIQPREDLREVVRREPIDVADLAVGHVDDLVDLFV